MKLIEKYYFDFIYSISFIQKQKKPPSYLGDFKLRIFINFRIIPLLLFHEIDCFHFQFVLSKYLLQFHLIEYFVG